MNIGIILSGGIGNRFGTKTPKQYQTINGKEILFYSIDALNKSKLIDKIIVIAQEQYIKTIQSQYGVIAIEGGNTRNRSLFNGLKFIKDNYECANVIILEAARPMITSTIVDYYLKQLNEYDAVITGQKIVASLGCYNMHSVNREDYYLIEAPEAFRFEILYKNFDPNSTITATNQQLPQDTKTYIWFGYNNNVKITYLQDLEYVKMLMEMR